MITRSLCALRSAALSVRFASSMPTLETMRPGLNEHLTVPHTEEIELYHNVLSGCSGKVRVGLAEKGIGFKSNHIHLIETGWYQTCSPAFKKVNPGATVPVLVHNGHPVYESSEQIQYVDKAFEGPSLTPKGLEDEVAKWVDFTSLSCTHEFSKQDTDRRLGCCLPGISMPLFVSMMHEISWTAPLYGLVHHHDKKRPVIFLMMKVLGPSFLQLLPLPAQMAKDATQSARAHLQKMEAETLSDGRTYLTGEEYTLADVGMITIIERMDNAGWAHLYEDLPHFTAYWERVKARPSYKTAITDEELPIIRRGRERIQKWKEERPDWNRQVFHQLEQIS